MNTIQITTSLEAAVKKPSPSRIARIFQTGHVICRDDVLFVLHYVQQKVASEDPLLVDLPKPRLIQSFQYFSEASLLLLDEHASHHCTQERLKKCLKEALFGLYEEHSS
ncbi:MULTISPECIES: hypothetical protein [Paenibacillus]|uniref:Uncharacterized protein n=1 Tax=Paenibacillus urinalis TaxID=521520 RepID=A0AAX3MYN0_9BACL|nr:MULTISPECIES: hypothetical protein [Paenibacillus]WDH81472.1 hypothetical protein PUW23_18340 [Paenibacillus urinalis]